MRKHAQAQGRAQGALYVHDHGGTLTFGGSMERLTAASAEEAAATYAEHGVAVWPGFFGPGQMAAISEAFREVVEGEAIGPVLDGNPRLQVDRRVDGSAMVRMVEPFLDLTPQLQELVDAPLRALAEKILGEPVALFEDKLNCKQSHGGSAFGWVRATPPPSSAPLAHHPPPSPGPPTTHPTREHRPPPHRCIRTAEQGWPSCLTQCRCSTRISRTGSHSPLSYSPSSCASTTPRSRM